VPAFQARIPFLSGGSFPYGTSIDHWTFTYVSGPTSLAATTIPATQFYVNYANATAGAYQVSGQAFDISSNPIGSPITVNFTVPDPIGNPPVSLATRAYLVGGTGANTFTLRFIYQSLGQFTARLDHTVITWSGPSSGSTNIAAGATTYTITGASNGDYNITMQGQDVSNNNLGPAMTNRVYYYDDTQTTPGQLIPKTPGVVILSPANTVGTPGL
jgi:hypothetical protein